MRLRALRLTAIAHGILRAFGLPLDNLTASAAYSIRKLRTAYTGPAVRVRRSSDNAEADIGFATAPQTRRTWATNPTWAGSVVGQPAPNGLFVVPLSGVTTSVAAVGNTPDGLPYVDLQITGTSAGNAELRLQVTGAATNGAPWSVGQRALFSIGLGIAAGSLTGVASVRLRISERTAAGGLNTFTSSAPLATLTTSLRRAQFAAVAVGGSTTLAHPEVILAMQAGVAVNLTLRLCVANIENGVNINARPLLTTGETTVADTGDLDVNALDAFMGGAGSDGLVTTWYDQSGNSRNATQATASGQPRIVNAGVVETLNNRPTVYFSGAQALTTPVALYVGANGTWSSNGVFNVAVASTNQHVIDCDTSNTANSRIAQYLRIAGGNLETIAFNGASGAFTSSAGSLTSGAATIGSSVRTSTNVQTFKNGAGGSVVGTSGTPASQSRLVVIGSRVTGVLFLTGAISELSLFNSALLASERGQLEVNQGGYFGIAVA